MLDYLLAIISLVAICSAWALFQIWIKKYNPNTVAFKSKCSGCSNASGCTTNPGSN